MRAPLAFLVLALAGCGSSGGEEPPPERYRVDAARTFSLADPAAAATDVEREARERANAQAQAVEADPGIGLELLGNGAFLLRLGPGQEASGSWTREGATVTLVTTGLLGQPVDPPLTSQATTLEEGLLRLSTEAGDVFLRRVP